MMVKQTTVYLYHGIILRNIKEQSINTCKNSNEIQGNCAEFSLKKKPISKGYIWYSFIYITLLPWHNYRDGERINGCQGSESMVRKMMWI